MAGDNRSIQVLNISNVNAQGKTVLNDGKLLELVLKYPFLYNRRVKGYYDSDYTDWAWKNINAAFNSYYANDPNAAFSIGCLIDRWNVLKPLIQCLSKAYDMEAIPESLRSSVIKICAELDEKSCTNVVKPYNTAQSLLLQNMTAISELPMDKRLKLEREILDIILSAEFECKQAKELKEAEWREISEDISEFLDDIGYKEVLRSALGRREKIFYNNYCNQYTTRNNENPRTLGWVPLNNVQKMIKPCQVNIRRINIEDYIPLAQIIQMNKTKYQEVEPEVKRESPGIFGI